MRSTLNLPANLMNDIIKLSGINNKTKLIIIALEEYQKKLKRERILKMRGKLSLDINIQEMRKMEMSE